MVLRWALQFAVWCFRSGDFKELEIVVLRQELAILRRRPRRPRDNPPWGYLRIVGEMKGLGFAVSATTVRTWLRQAGLGPVGTRGGTTWRAFVRAHRHRMLAVDFFAVETIWLQRLYVLFFIE